MLAIQSAASWVNSGANWWVDSIARFAGGHLGENIRSEFTTTGDAAKDNDVADSMTSVISDAEGDDETGEIENPPETQASTMDAIYDGLRDGDDRNDSSSEVIAAAASQIQIIEAAMRQHQASGLGKFGDQDFTSDEDADDASQSSLTGDLMLNPALPLAAIAPGNDRAGVLALLR